MKRNLLLSTLLLASASMAAQGFDGSFDGPWETCYPDGKTAVGYAAEGLDGIQCMQELHHHDEERISGSRCRPYRQ